MTDYAKVNALALKRFDDLIEKLHLNTKVVGKECQFINPKRQDTDFGSASINIETGVWADFANDDAKGGDLVSLVAYLGSFSQKDAASWIKTNLSDFAIKQNDLFPEMVIPELKAKVTKVDGTQLYPVPVDAPAVPDSFNKLGKPSQVYTYKNAEGRTNGYILRFDEPGGGKQIRPLTLWRDKNNVVKWQSQGFPKPHPLYNLDELAIQPDAAVVIVEGEKSADAAKVLFPERVVTTSMHGAKSASKADWTPLLGRNILIWPDNDQPGKEYANEIVQILLNQNGSTQISVMKPLAYCPEVSGDGQLKPMTEALPNGFDAADALEAGWTAALLALIPWDKFADEPCVAMPANAAYSMPEEVAAIVKGQFHGNLLYVNRTFLGYAEGVWSVLDEDAEVSHWIGIRLGADAHISKVKDTLGLIKVFQARKYEDTAPDLNLICLRNGTLNTQNYELLMHSPNHNLKCKVDVSWDPEALCPRWLLFLDEIFAIDIDKMAKIQFVQEWFGYCLTPDNSQHKFVWMVGAGGNGKSVMLSMLTHLVGRKNVSNAHIERLGDEFVRAELEGKLVNISAEMSANATMSDGYLKSIVAGDEIEAERKFKPSFSFRPYVRLIGATNHLPRLLDLSEGFFRRAIILNFNRRFGDDERDPSLEKTLVTELPGILAWAVEGLKTLRERGGFNVPQSSAAALGQYRGESDTERMFVDECLVISVDDRARLSPAEIYGCYVVWCRRSGYRPKNIVNLGKRLAEFGIVKSRSGGKDYWGVTTASGCGDVWGNVDYLHPLDNPPPVDHGGMAQRYDM